MRTTMLAWTLAAAAVSLWPGRQDPAKPVSPPAVPPPAATPPAATPAPAEATKGQPARHPYEGVYQLRRRTIAGELDPRVGAGYVAITRRHLFLCLMAPGPDPHAPLMRAGVRSWQPGRDDAVQTEVQLGFYTDGGGDVHLEPQGQKQVRRIEILRGLLRIHQDEKSFLEFERIE